VYVVGATPTWGNAAGSFWCKGTYPQGSSSIVLSVNLTAPTAAGTYHIIVAGRGEFNCTQVFSGTNWAAGSAIWGDGNDIAQWSSASIATAMASGQVCADWWTASGWSKVWVAATAVRLVVK
jgi:hypothetical protein